MPRTSRAPAGGYCYHVLNRGNARAEVFHKDQDFQAFLDMIAEASLRQPMPILAYCLMPNYFHDVARVRQSLRGLGPGRPGWLPTPAPLRSGSAHHKTSFVTMLDPRSR